MTSQEWIKILKDWTSRDELASKDPELQRVLKEYEESIARLPWTPMMTSQHLGFDPSQFRWVPIPTGQGKSSPATQPPTSKGNAVINTVRLFYNFGYGYMAVSATVTDGHCLIPRGGLIFKVESIDHPDAAPITLDPWLSVNAGDRLNVAISFGVLIWSIDRQCQTAAVQHPETFGATCVRCKRHNEYASANAKYVCYECRT